jgi:hypothetical protein
MNLSALDNVLWVSGFLGQAALFSILIYRHRWREFPVFTAYIGFEVAMCAALYSISLLNSYVWYSRAYWSYAIIDETLQFGIVWEIARIVLRPTGTWVQDARRQFILGGAAGVLLAAALPWLLTPTAPNWFGALVIRVGLISALVICEMYFLLIRVSRSLGLGWRNHVMALGNGWTAWSLAAILVEGLHSYFGIHHYYRDLEHVRMIVFDAVLCYWMVQFWLKEPVRQPISPELRAYIEALHLRIKNNLDTLEAQR